MKNYLIMAALFTGQIFAAGAEIKVLVNGMVCSFCSQGVKRGFQKHTSIENVRVDLEKKEVALSVKEGKSISDEEITKVINDSSLNVGKILR